MFHVKQKNFDIVVVGAGHAGMEAAIVASKMGASTALITFSENDIGTMSCNPAMGGLGKGHLIREIDALGGVIGICSDLSGIQFRVLNKTRGEAVQGPRAQIDRNFYKKNAKELVLNSKLHLIFDEVTDIKTTKKKEKDTIQSIVTSLNDEIFCKSIIVTTGTFLSGLIYRGNEKWPAGRLGSEPSIKLAKFFNSRRFTINRLKTGTPPRLFAKSIDFKKCATQKGDFKPEPFSFLTDSIDIDQKNCHITYTNSKTHKIIEKNFENSPIFNGLIESKGPRYCPSIEDKVRKFSDRDRHQIFLEPETIEGDVIYPNGISTSLPTKVQLEFLQTIKGLENVRVDKFGYAIEYDCIDSNEIRQSFETKKVEGLFLAGQINGTTGYEEAAAQGILAGINATLKISGKQSFIVKRSQGYLGVLSSDLSKGGLIEPYRMFTSRAEYRLFLRADNADERLTDLAINLGIVNSERLKKWQRKKEIIRKAKILLSKLEGSPQTYNKFGLKINFDGKKRNAYEVLGFPNASWDLLTKIWPEIGSLKIDYRTRKQIRANSFYERYSNRQLIEINELEKDKDILLRSDIDLSKCEGLSNEIKDILISKSPKNIAEARQLPGMTPAAASILLRYVKK